MPKKKAQSESPDSGDVESIEEPDSPGSTYAAIIAQIFRRRYRKGAEEFVFDRDEIEEAASSAGVKKPKNLGDVVYSFRYRRALPHSILKTQPKDRSWLILGAGDAKYRFRLAKLAHIKPTVGLMVRKIPDATPEIISQYARKEEQALLAKIRYNRLVDIFLGIATYSLQNHLRTKVANYGQIEIDELYVGVDTYGVHYVVPVQAKAGRDFLGVIQSIQDAAFCASEPLYSSCVCRPVSAQFLDENTIALFETVFDGNEVSIKQEKHYRLAAAKEISNEDLKRYRQNEV